MLPVRRVATISTRWSAWRSHWRWMPRCSSRWGSAPRSRGDRAPPPRPPAESELDVVIPTTPPPTSDAGLEPGLDLTPRPSPWEWRFHGGGLVTVGAPRPMGGGAELGIELGWRDRIDVQLGALVTSAGWQPVEEGDRRHHPDGRSGRRVCGLSCGTDPSPLLWGPGGGQRVGSSPWLLSRLPDRRSMGRGADRRRPARRPHPKAGVLVRPGWADHGDQSRLRQARGITGAQAP